MDGSHTNWIPSYRLKTDGDYSFEGLRSFSVQHPSTRNYLHEWFLHQLCDDNDLLSTTYEFVRVKMNKQHEGVQALEEHFDKELLESRRRREGPILKIDESAIWALRNTDLGSLGSASFPYYEAAIVSCFKKNRTRKSETLSAQFYNGAILLDLFKTNYTNPELLFDLDQLAKYYALLDLGNVRHSLAWHNRRFYYNPVTAKLEHVGFDMIPMVMPMNPIAATIEFNRDWDSTALEERLDFYVFKNVDFREKYTTYLTAFSKKTYLDSVFASYEEQLADLQDIIHQEVHEGYTFNKAGYYEKAALIRQELKTLDKRWDNYLKREITLPQQTKKDKYKLDESDFYMKEISVNAYLTELDNDRYKIQLENYHYAPVTIVGVTLKSNKEMVSKLNAPVTLNGFTGDALADTATFIIQGKPSRICFSLANRDGEIKQKKFIKWAKPQGTHPRIELHQKFSPQAPFYTVEEKELFINGDVTINELVYIPKGYKVFITQGTTIDFVNGGGLIINDVVNMVGTKDAVVTFTSSDRTGMGITILNSPEVIINNVTVKNMNALDYKGWALTGAVSIYQSAVLIDGLIIENNNSEDALNIIRSDFTITNCLIKNTKSDGFDADFCTGSIEKAVFENTGNDCIDFSGSEVSLSDIIIVNAGDKGISAGEKSTLTIENININGAVTGMSSKDGSRITGKNIQLNNAKVGVSLFRKKSVYATSSMLLDSVKYKGLANPALIEMGAVLTFDSTVYNGYQILDIDKMYERFE